MPQVMTEASEWASVKKISVGHQKNLHNSIFLLIFVVPNNERYGKE